MASYNLGLIKQIEDLTLENEFLKRDNKTLRKDNRALRVRSDGFQLVGVYTQQYQQH
jgi:hypothetical protein